MLPKAKNPPDRIWLQVGEIEMPCEFAECADGVSWCAEKIFDNDVEYRIVKRPRKKPRATLNT